MYSIRLAFRRLRRHPGFTLLNASGLAIGLACALLALFYIRDETRVDRFHQDADRIYSVVMADTLLAPEVSATPYPLGLALADLPEVASVIRRSAGSPARMRAAGSTNEIREPLLMTDAGFFDFFSFPIVSGSAQPLVDPSGIVLTPHLGQTLFGDVDPVGQIVEVFKPWPEPTWVPLTASSARCASTRTFDYRIRRGRALRVAARRVRRPRELGDEQLPHPRPPCARHRRGRLFGSSPQPHPRRRPHC